MRRQTRPAVIRPDRRSAASSARSTAGRASRGTRRVTRQRLLRRSLLILALSSVSAAGVAVAVQVTFPFPVEKLEHWPSSPRVEDRTGRPLLQLVGEDGHWRFPVPLDEMSPWIVQATIAAEDERFNEHSGVDATALLRAVLQNVRAGGVVSGASTITMQLCRMVDERPRTFSAKLIEVSRAFEIEQRLSKTEILESYLNIAPYGGNVRGVEAASLRYFRKRACDLSLGEAALLAGLPKSPTRFRPDRFPDRAQARQAYVLRRMREVGMISTEQESLAKSWTGFFATDNKSRPSPRIEYFRRSDWPIGPEGSFLPSMSPGPLSAGPVPLPQFQLVIEQAERSSRGEGTLVSSIQNVTSSKAPRGAHAAWLALRRRPEGGRTTIDSQRQAIVETLVNAQLSRLPEGSDIAAVVIDIESSEIVTMVGSPDFADPIDGQVNGVLARRSPGSTLKPFLYAAAFDARRLNAESVIDDAAIERAGWRPDNFDRTFHGRMMAADALRESRNVPAILLLEALGTSRCLGVMNAAGIRLPDHAAQRGGLAIAVGAVETSLLDLTNAYATLGRDGRFTRPRLFPDEPLEERVAISGPACRTVNAILASTERDPHGCEDVPTGQLPWFMWKTGTSSGRRDAWAIGHNGRFAIGIWVGRFSGAGHESFLGREAAEPLLARLFTHRLFETTNVPELPTPIRVNRPLNLVPDSGNTSPLIVSPTSQSEWLCADGNSALVPVAVRNAETATWFLNGRPAARTKGSLNLKPGSYELRCVASNGQSTAVTFSVTRN